MSNEISLMFLIKVLKKAWWKILIFTVIVALLVAAVTEFFIDKKYSSTTEFYILNTSSTSEYTTQALLSAAEYLANDYIEIILGDRMMEEVIADLTELGVVNCTPTAIRSMISTSTSADSSIFTVTVTHTDSNIAYYVSKSIKENAPEIIKEISRPSYISNMYRLQITVDKNGNTVENYVKISESDMDCVIVLRSPELAKTHVAPSLLKNTFLGTVIAAFIAYLFFFIRKLLDTTIRSEESAKELTNQTVIGDIPSWSSAASVQDNKKNKN